VASFQNYPVKEKKSTVVTKHTIIPLVYCWTKMFWLPC